MVYAGVCHPHPTDHVQLMFLSSDVPTCYSTSMERAEDSQALIHPMLPDAAWLARSSGLHLL